MLKQMMMASTLAAAGAVTGCGSQTPDFKRNPHPVEQYEITVTVKDAPGPLVFTDGSALYQAFDCAYPVNRIAGSWGQPESLQGISYTQVTPSTAVGYFFIDQMLDEDYDGSGNSNPCHWQLMNVGLDFQARDVDGATRFNGSISAKHVLENKPVTLYFNRIRYPSKEGTPNYSYAGEPRDRFGPSIQDSDLFSVTLVTRRVTP